MITSPKKKKKKDRQQYQGSLGLHIFKIEIPTTNSSFIFILQKITRMYYRLVQHNDDTNIKK